MYALVRLGWAQWTSGYGWHHGDIVELTEEGKRVRQACKEARAKILNL